MIKLIGLNLLPYREVARQKKKEAFNRLMLLCGLVGLVLAGVIWFALSQMIDNQQDRNRTLQENIEILNKEIKEVDQLEQRRDEFLARKQKIEELQNDRYKAAMIFNDLNRLMPDGTFLTHIQSKDGKDYEFTGVALNDRKVAQFMDALPSTGLFKVPDLVGIKTDKGVQVFTIRTSLVRSENDAVKSEDKKDNKGKKDKKKGKGK